MHSLWMILAINFTAMLAVMLLLWRLAVKLHSVSFIDIIWAYGIVALALATAVQSGVGTLHAQILLIVTLVWGARLGTHLLVRWRKEGEDKRYQKILDGAMKRTGYSWSTTALLLVFLLQLPLLYITSLPTQIGIWAAAVPHSSIDGEGLRALGWLGWLGFICALVGIIFESVSDAQLKTFRLNPANKGKYLDNGLWRYSRHPNYFGDLLTWWGLWLVATDIALWVGLASLIGPVFLTFTLTRWSGVPMTERSLHKSRPGYEEYVARTSTLLPWPPRPSRTLPQEKR